MHLPWRLALISILLLSCSHKASDPKTVVLEPNAPEVLAKLLPMPPQALKKNRTYRIHGETLQDNYYWLRDRTNPEVLELLKKENAYTESVLAPVDGLQSKLFSEMKERIKEDDISVPEKKGDYFYYVREEKGKQYKIYCRKKHDLDEKEEILLDLNQLAEGKDFVRLGVFEVSPDGKKLAFAVDYKGDEVFTLFVKNLETGELLSEKIPNVTYSLAWFQDSERFLYTTLDKELRPKFIYFHRLGQNFKQDKLVYQEKDSTYFIGVDKSEDEKFLFIETGNQVSSEVRYLASDSQDFNFKLFEKRKQGHEYYPTHHDHHFYILTNDRHENFRLVKVSDKNPGKSHWKEVIAGNSDVLLERIQSFKNFLVLQKRVRGNAEIGVMALNGEKTYDIELPTKSHAVHLANNPEFDTDLVRFQYSSLKTPSAVYDFNMKEKELILLKEKEIPTYDADDYVVEKIEVRSWDGAMVPVHLVYNKDKFKKDGTHPVYLYGYGAYGSSMDPYFNSQIISLLDRGFLYAFAQVRGGSEFGRSWYNNGKFLKKRNSFSDFIKSAEFLIENGWAGRDKVVICGRSAGGLLVGASMMMRPDLFKVVVAGVPFVDVLNTMLDPSLPLTTIEYDEWGNPQNKKYFDYIKSYSPYDNVKKENYPYVFATAGLSDPRVTYWEPLKWIQKIRENKTDTNKQVLFTNLEAGHGGASGRYDVLKERAMEYAFILQSLGMTNP